MEDQKKQMSGTQWFLLAWLIIAASLIIAGLREKQFLLVIIGGIMSFTTLFIGRKTEQ